MWLHIYTFSPSLTGEISVSNASFYYINNTYVILGGSRKLSSG